MVLNSIIFFIGTVNGLTSKDHSEFGEKLEKANKTVASGQTLKDSLKIGENSTKVTASDDIKNYGELENSLF